PATAPVPAVSVALSVHSDSLGATDLRRVSKERGGEHLLETPSDSCSWRISLLRLRLSLVGVLLLISKDTKYLLQGVLFFLGFGVGVSRALPRRVRRPVRIVNRHRLPIGICLCCFRLAPKDMREERSRR